METRDRSKRTKIMENESEVITPETRSCIYEHFVPLDLLIEILRSLPLKSLARFLLVSKSWATIIRSRDFIRSFSLQHSLLSQPPLLLACKALDDPNIWRFFSSSSSSASEPLSHLSFTTCANITNPQSRCCSVDTNPRYVNGLISLGFGREQMVCNPRTGKSITLPKVKSRKQIIRTFFGYDPVDCQHKLLCMSEKSYLRSGEPSFEHQVFTLGGVDTSWKMIECSIIHRPQTNGVCINGVVYYGAWMCTHSSDYCLVRFDVRSEKYGQVVQFSSDHCSPSLLSDQDSYLISYKGKVTLAIKGKQLMSYDLWVLKDAEKHEWSKAREGDTTLGFMLSKPKNIMESRYRSKRAKITEKESGIIDKSFVPLDLVIEILRRLPLKSLARFLLVAKSWATIIRSRDFIRSFPYQSSLIQPRHTLLAFKYFDDKKQIWNFFSSSSSITSEPLSNLPLTTSLSITSRYSRFYNADQIPRYANGLVSLGCGQEQMICNPSTGKSIALPKVKSRKKTIRSFFGYDPVDDQHKLLCMSEKAYRGPHRPPSFEHQVFTLGGVDKSWKMIECNVPHLPQTNGVCFNGVVYYGAYMGTLMKECCLVRFNVRSEKFDQVVRFLGDHSPPPPLLSSLRYPSMISYKGKVTLATRSYEQMMRYELWVLEDAEKHEWSKVCISIQHPLINSSMWQQLRIGGDSSRTGEIVLSLTIKDFFVLSTTITRRI
ncbi:unnamed protein product [Microthlaspi erraticum]|uniref:F-box domain-containing protein n=1 Tax=Microthlaspi erraticum TaxID=1685480 RepID=A0A6D2KAE5_9BRAS|nr:unnamed protein product [Microthlaspi erraticum]